VEMGKPSDKNGSALLGARYVSGGRKIGQKKSRARPVVIHFLESSRRTVVT
jgi:hypothetical protein